jgi:hypothetical protein
MLKTKAIFFLENGNWKWYLNGIHFSS